MAWVVRESLKLWVVPRAPGPLPEVRWGGWQGGLITEPEEMGPGALGSIRDSTCVPSRIIHKRSQEKDDYS